MPKISDLAAISALDEDDVLAVVEDGTTKKVTLAQLRLALGGYVFIEEITVGVGGAAMVDFDSIPATYRHLQLRYWAQSEGTLTAVRLYLNGDTTLANYYTQRLLSQATTASAATFQGTNSLIGAATATATSQPAHGEIDIPYYARTTHRKGSHGRVGYHDGTNNNLDNWYVLWTNTAAINRVAFVLDSGADFKEGSIFSLYGIS